MIDSPPPLAYQRPPRHDHKISKFILGLVLGALAMVTVFFGVTALDYTARRGDSSKGLIVAPTMTFAMGVAMSFNGRFRPIGLGIITAIPMTFLALFVLCAIAVMHA